jgi:hypothetical protein
VEDGCGQGTGSGQRVRIMWLGVYGARGGEKSVGKV